LYHAVTSESIAIEEGTRIFIQYQGVRELALI
jgi:hypothetical protein